MKDELHIVPDLCENIGEAIQIRKEAEVKYRGKII